MDGKKTSGRRKIPMKMIEIERDRLITFSKRRSGIYKKAGELAELCNVDVGIFMFSPSQKPFSFGNPSVKTVLSRFTKPDHEGNYGVDVADIRRTANNAELDQVKVQVEALKARERELRKVLKKGDGWWEKPADDLQQIREQIEFFKDLRRPVESVLRQRGDGASGSADPDA